MLLRRSAFATLVSAAVSGALNDRSTSSIFALPGLSIAEAPAANVVELLSHPSPKPLASPFRARYASFDKRENSIRKRQSAEQVTNTIFSGVYPVINVTWGNKDGASSQSFVSFIDTGSSDTFAVSDGFQCVGLETKIPQAQTSCRLGPLYNTSLGKFTNITNQKFNITYFPEMQTMGGSMGYAPITLGGLTVPQQQVALIDYAAWSGDTFTSGLLGVAYPSITLSTSRTKPERVMKYDPVFTSMTKQGLVGEAVFTLAIDRVPWGTPAYAPAGVMAFGGLVPSKYYDAPFTSVPIEADLASLTKQLTFYTTTLELLYGLANGTVVSGGTFQGIIDSGTAPNMIPSAAAADLNKQFVPPAVYNKALRYWVVDCNATAPYAAFKIGGKVMPMDPRDMIVRSLNGLLGYENTCFSVFGDGGDPVQGQMIVGAVWQRGYVIAYDQGRGMMHFATRKPY